MKDDRISVTKKLCECGCGKAVSSGHRFRLGHHIRVLWKDSKYREKRSKEMRSMWKNPKYRKKMSESHNRPEVKEKKSLQYLEYSDDILKNLINYKFCKCGCGFKVKEHKTFLNGHNIAQCSECSNGIDNTMTIEIVKDVDNVLVKFCSDSCRYVYMERIKDNIREYMSENMITELKEDVKDELKSELEEELELKLQVSRDKGYQEGVIDTVRRVLTVCPRCNKRDVESVHHLIPREFGGYTELDNIIPLCKDCHDEVEIKTHKLFKNGTVFDSKTLRSFVIGEFPETEEV